MKEQTADLGRHHRPSHSPSRIHWGAAVWAGIIAGLVFMMAEMLMVWMFLGESPWGPPRMIAAMVLGREVLPPPADFALVPMMVAMVIRFMLSIVYGLVIGFAMRSLGMGKALIGGAVFGLLAVYMINFHLIAPLLSPWFTRQQNWVSVVTHVLFGMVLAGSYVALRDRRH